MGKAIFFFFLILVLGAGGYIYWFYYNAYSDGYREGILQKFSHKGNVMKTYEGELIQLGFGQRNATSGFNAQYFSFSVADQKLADSLEKCTGKVVDLHYTQYRRSLPWRGENYTNNQESGQYIVDGIRSVREATVY